MMIMRQIICTSHQETENLFEDTNNFYSEEIQDSKEDNIIYPKFIKEGEDKVSAAAKVYFISYSF